MDLVKLIEMGERMGLKGTNLQAFANEREKQALEREERAQRREEEKIKLQMVWEKEKMMLQLETAEKEAEIKKKTDKRQLNILKAKAKLSGKEEAEPDKSTGVKALRPKLPKFDEEKDDTDAFLERFERFASSQGWPEKIWAVSLSPLLTGKGLQLYSSMPSDQANNYEELKKAILKRYQLTEEGFRLKFREEKPQKSETVFQFMSRLRLFKRWTEMAQAGNTFESLEDLLIREQFTQSCSTDKALFLKERAPKSVAEMTKPAEQYLEAHAGNKMCTRPLTNMRSHKGPPSVGPSPPTAGFRPFVRGSPQLPHRLAEMPKKVEVTKNLSRVWQNGESCSRVQRYSTKKKAAALSIQSGLERGNQWRRPLGAMSRNWRERENNERENKIRGEH